MNAVPIALTIAGSDSGGGAGIQADLKTFFALGCHGTSALTALTAQNTTGVTEIHAVPPGFVRAQIDAVVTDMGVDAAKTGMLASAPVVEAVAAAVSAHGIRLVVDPVFVSKHRDPLLEEDAVGALKGTLFPLAELITPNLYEASALAGFEVETKEDMKKAAEVLLSLGPRAVLVKGGHLAGERATDIFYDGSSFEEVAGPRFETEDTHGTGCALSAAITAHLARGAPLPEAVAAGKTFISGAIEHALRIGRGYGPVNPGWGLPL